MDKITAKLIINKQCFPGYSRDMLLYFDKMYKELIRDVHNLKLSVSSFIKCIQYHQLSFKYIKSRKTNLWGGEIGTLYISYLIDIENSKMQWEIVSGKTRRIEDVIDIDTKKELLMIEFEQILSDIIFALNLSYGGILNISE